MIVSIPVYYIYNVVTCIFMNATWYVHLFFSVTYRSTPVETLHTILLGTCKYLLRSFMTKRKEEDKKEILARMSSGFSTKVHGNVWYYYQSFVGRDFKGWMQMAIFIISSY